MAVAGSPETSANFDQTIQHHIPEQITICRGENLKSQKTKHVLYKDQNTRIHIYSKEHILTGLLRNKQQNMF
jgi:hypothetical protein